MYNLFKALLLLCSVFLLWACSSDSTKEESVGSSTLTLKLTGVTGGKLFIQELRDQTWITIDSSASYNGNQTFKIAVSEPDFYRIVDAGTKSGIVILEPGKTATVEGDLKNMAKTFKSADSKSNNDYYVFQHRLSNFIDQEEKLDRKYKEFMEAASTKDSANYYGEKLNEKRNESDQFIKSYIDSIMPSFAVYGMVNYLRIEKEFDYMYALADRIRKEMPNSKYSRLFVGEISRMKTIKEEQAAKDAQGKAAIGKPAPNFTLQDRSGKAVSLSSLKGQYVLIDFWASWCGPCRAESPNMVKLYNKFKGKNFQILGVSLDGSEDAWNGAIEKDGLTWLHVSDLMQWNSPVVALYGIDGIPATVIVDPNGIIVAKNLRGEELLKALDKLLKK
ncbi:MAG: ccmG [Cytophagaceae bacterium]|jgi:peroxiredoxin|nr:ccmG [Cytophagaceae bacterium]